MALRKYWLVLLTLALGIGVFAVSACNDDDGGEPTDAPAASTPAASDVVTDGDPILIGSIQSESGNFVIYGEGALIGVDLAVADLNEAGGIVVDGVRHMFEVVKRDDRSETSVAAAAALELTEDIGVTVLAASVINSLTGAILPVAQDCAAIMFAPGTILDPELTAENVAFPDGRSRCMFKTLTSGEDLYGGYGPIIKEFDPDIQKVVMLWPDAEATTINEPSFRNGVEAQGMDLVVIKYPSGTTDFSSILLRVKDEDPDILFVSFLQADALVSVRQAIELEAAPAFMGVNLNPSIATEDAIGEPIEQPFLLLGSVRLPFDPSTPASEAFYAKYIASGGTINELAGFSLFYYDHILMVAEAMQVAGTVTDLDAIAEALEDLEYDGVLGRITYGELHIPLQGYDFCSIILGSDITCEAAENIARS